MEARLASPSRRSVLKGSGAAAALTFLGASSALLAGCGGSEGETAVADDSTSSAAGVPRRPNHRPAALGFPAVGKSTADEVTLAAGYTAKVLLRLGDPIAAGVLAYNNDGTDDAASFAMRSGDHHDALLYFGLGPNGKWHKNESNRGLLCTNHEAITPMFLHPNGVTTSGSGAAQRRTVAEEVLREFYVHGVSIVEVARDKNFDVIYRQDSPFNRRVHTLTPMQLSGPAAGTPYMVTKHSPEGTQTRGTINNCANGTTPWGTYLTCEENWAGYFRRVAAENAPGKSYSAKELAAFARYGVSGNGRELWATLDPNDDQYARWNVALKGDTAADDYRNAANTYGWNVEIDPFDPASTPKKRTAMGRIAHEGAWLAKVETGKPLVWYMGCDARNEYIYKYVSNQPWNPSDANNGLAAGDKYLDDGKLYVARFNADGTGNWLELAFGAGNVTPAYAPYSFADQADVAINTRLAADAQGGTKMDRPEWGAVDPVTGAVYLTLTNNTNSASTRNINALDAANPRFYREVASSPSSSARAGGNPNGHIIRWLESTPTAMTFVWDIFLFGARADRDANVNVSGLTADNDFSSPDGIWFSPTTNICWIQTDDGAFSDATNDMLLAALPGHVGDGGVRTITSVDGSTVKQVQTFVGAPLGDKLRRFLVGVPGCEITGITETPDGKTIFVNVQHPGEGTAPADIRNPAAYQSHWPDGGLARPRSSTLAITKADKGLIGL
ncbi:MAG TPA: PhoX family phosphatase [Burkholderiaceae bacterium]|nr:PhoX family phosphatase [Burkholderiaceae bacterium]